MNINNIPLFRVRLKQHDAPILDVAKKVEQEFGSIRSLVKPGMSIAIATGSRGVGNIALIVKTLAALLKECGAEPFVVPAMGSHGGATDEGQAAVLRDYGITEEAVGAPVRSSLRVEKIGSTGGDPDIPVYMDQNAWNGDGVIAINRVKAHTDFHGQHESGIVKMLTIGLGKHRQAIEMHRYGAQGLHDNIPRVSKKVLESGKILACLAILEDGHDQTSDLCFATGEDVFTVDHSYLLRSKAMMAKLPFAQIDALVVEWMGKDISGTGMDTNVIGRIRIDGQQDAAPKVNSIAVLDLTPASHGNALGVGLADVTTKQLYDKIDQRATYQNVVTSGFLQRGFIPLVMDTEEAAINLCINTSGCLDEDKLRYARIKNTLDLEYIEVSKPLLDELLQSGMGELA